MDKITLDKRPVEKTDSPLAFSKPGLIVRIKQLIQFYLAKYQILNFMVVGGIGFLINMAIYWPLTIVFKTQVKILGQQYFLIPFIISSCVAIICNYELNRIWTFRGWRKQSLAPARYFSMAAVTLLLDCAMLTFFIDIAHIHYVLAAALAIMVVFIVRFVIARKWVWLKD